MTDVKILTARRGIFKASLTRFETFLNKFISEKSTDFRELQQRLENVVPLLEEFNNLQFDIEIASTDADEEIQIDNNTREQFENTYHTLVASARALIENSNSISIKDSKSHAPSSVSEVSVHSSNSNKSQAAESNTDPDRVQNNNNDSPQEFFNNQFSNSLTSNLLQGLLSQNSSMNLGLKLPDINLPKFDGSLDDWLCFRDTFRSVIHEKSNLSGIQKFHYLRLSLKGEAAEILRDMQISETSYDIAWKILLDHYEDSNALINHHIRTLINIPPIIKESHSNIKSLLMIINHNITVLKNLGEPTECWDSFIINLIYLKLDSRSKQKWDSKCLNLAKPRLKDLTEFLTNRYKLLPKFSKDTPTSQSSFFNPKSKGRSLTVTSCATCPLCNENHIILNCSNFISLSPKSRYERARHLKLCINCLREYHPIGECRSSKCRKCNKPHHTLLHFEFSETKAQRQNHAPNKEQSKKEEDNQPSVINPSSAASSQAYCSFNDNCVLLSTALVTVLNVHGNPEICRCLLDSGSQINFISKACANRLGLKSELIQGTITGIDKQTSKISSRTNIKLSSRTCAFTSRLTCLIIDNITSHLPCGTFDKDILQIPPNLILADPGFNVSSEIDILLGAEIFWDILCAGQIKPSPNSPTLQKTTLGWIISGPISLPRRLNNVSNAVNTSFHALCVFNNDTISHESLEELNTNIRRFWQIQEPPNEKIHLAPEELFCEKYFLETTLQDDSGRFIVQYPLKESPNVLGESQSIAEKRFYFLESKLKRNPDLKGQYSKFIHEYIQLGHMSLVSQPNFKPLYYLPHHCVIKEDSTTTKLRVVFDGSSKTSTGYSLNNIMTSGPTIQNDLFSILLRFRKHTYVLTGDVEKMYRQVLIAPDQRSLQCILWRDDPSQSLSIYQLNTITYGLAASSFLAIRCLHEIGHRLASKNPLISSIILEDFYVDDLLTGGSSSAEILKIKEEVSSTLLSYGFPLRKLLSNVCKNSSNSSVTLGSNEPTKTLGLLWHPDVDALTYSIKINPCQGSVTKRSILSHTAQIFDPLGLLLPFIITAKIILQKLWQLRLSWDESVPLDLHTKWINFQTEISHLSNISIPRHVISKNPKLIELHGFADASQCAYGAVIYAKSIDQDNSLHCHILCAKNRVAPLKILTIPKLELCAAMLLAELMRKVINSLKLNIQTLHYYTDSTIVLSWIKASPHMWKVFVANRVSQIQSLSNPDQWFYIPTENNPADLLTRGISTFELENSKLWWYGPDMLNSPINKQESLDFPQINPSDLPEIRSKAVFLSVTTTTDFHIFPYLNKFSNFTHLVRVFAYVLRFCNNLKNKQHRFSGCLLPKELDDSLNQLIKIVQSKHFSKEISEISRNGIVPNNSPILKLSPILDDSGILRVGGRLKLSSFNFMKKHPALLPKGHNFSISIARREHERLLHAGPQHTLASLRERFWLLDGRNIVRKVIRNCTVCFKLNAKPVIPLMGELPVERTTPTRPFLFTGIDYAGPFKLKDRITRNYKLTKAYICLFICLSTKAIHLELVGDLSTNLFLAALRRFIARRGKPTVINSDNGTNLVGGSKELKLFFETASNEIATNVSNEGITWKFIPANAPHFGGIWESGVKSVKYHLRRLVGNITLNYEQFCTILTQIEAVLNSRPLYPSSDDPNDLSPITPSHFLIGASLESIPEPSLLSTPDKGLKQFQLCQKLVQGFWQRWSREYISQLQTRNKWARSPQVPIKPGILVLIKEDNLSPLHWKLGRIIEVYPGKDGVVRVASVKTSTGIYKRPVVKLCVLPNQSV